MIAPIELAKKLEDIVCRVSGGVFERRYWRFRGGRWYGGIATADCVGCNLSCVFCGPVLYMSRKKISGNFMDPASVVKRLTSIAFGRKYRYLRVSGGEPTICFDHLLQVLDEVERYPFLFILETNGILFGYDKGLAEKLSDFEKVHVRVSIKGTNEEECSKLTMAHGKFFDYQLEAIKNLRKAGVSFHVAVVASFSTPENVKKFENVLEKIDPEVAEGLEIEYITLYPHVVESLKRHGIVPVRAYTVDWKLINEAEYKKLFGIV